MPLELGIGYIWITCSCMILAKKRPAKIHILPKMESLGYRLVSLGFTV